MNANVWRDIKKLKDANYALKIMEDEELLLVKFQGPQLTPYAGGVWHILFEFPHNYPNLPPIVKFSNFIFHPNVDAGTGLVCMNALKRDWQPTYNLLTIFEYMLPQFLIWPNPCDSLNKLAGELMINNYELFKKHAQTHAGLSTRTE